MYVAEKKQACNLLKFYLRKKKKSNITLRVEYQIASE